MIKNYLKIALRNLVRNKVYSFINIGGLAVGMAVAMLIGLWIYDELSFNHYHQDYQNIALIQKNRNYNGTINTDESNCIPLGEKLRESYGNDFEEVVVSSFGMERNLKYKETSIIKRGYFMEKGGEKILDLKIIEGKPTFPLDPSSILISKTVAKSLFGKENPLEKVITIDNGLNFKVIGVYQDLPKNSTFRSVNFYASFDAFAQIEDWVRNSKDSWEENSFPIYVKTAKNVNMGAVSEKIKNVVFQVTKDESKPQLFLYAMADWHLYPDFINGKMVGSGVENIWIFGLVGIFVFLLASINFMNLSTARSEKRAKEIGIRKTSGSNRNQLILQFYIETLLTVFLASFLSILLAQLTLPFFNEIAEKQLDIPWLSPVFGSLFLAFIFLNSFLSGSYPALFLSSLNPIKVLKGKLVSGNKETFSRKGLVVFQFSISVVLITSTIVIFRQIQYAQNRPLGYDTEGLIQISKRSSPNLSGHYFAMRQDLLNTGAVVEMAEMNSPIYGNWHNNSGLTWRGQAPSQTADFGQVHVTPEFGKTVNWEILKGRDFSRLFSTDSSAIILNETAAKLIGFSEPIDEIIKTENKDFHIIGVTKDIVMDSPFGGVKPTVFMMINANAPFITIKLKPELSASSSLAKVEEVLKKYDSEGNFNIKFADYQFNDKFWREKRMANLSISLSFIAIFISCLGIFGLSAFVAEQRVKEIGIRKILGASVPQLWALLSKGFVFLVIISLFIATPIAYYFMSDWLQKYTYRTEISWWIFAVSGLGALAITLLTVSWQSIKAALMNPVKSLRSE
jgi:ABC-type antimicrobial peptide transport system permease subunit